jgi:hypothetical protein
MATQTSSATRQNARPPRSKIRRVREVLRLEGIKGLVLKVLARLCYREIVLVERELRNLWLEPATDVPIQVRRLRRKDVPAYLELRLDQSEEDVLRRLDSGHFCYVTWTNGRMSSAVWMQDGPVWIPEVDRYLPLQRDEVYSYDSFTAPDVRGRNVAAARGATTTRLLRACGYRNAVGFVLPENRAGFRPPEKLGVRRCGRIGYFQLGPIRIEFYERGDEKKTWTVRRSPRWLFRRPAPQPL